MLYIVEEIKSRFPINVIPESTSNICAFDFSLKDGRAVVLKIVPLKFEDLFNV